VSDSRRVGVDLTPLRVSGPFRRIYIYGLVAQLASQATYVTVMFQLRVLTHSAFDVGALGLVEFVPIFVLGLYGGVIADRFDRRRVMIACECSMLVVVALLFVNARLTHPTVAVIFVVAGLLAALSGLQSPSQSALIQQFVSHDLQRSSATLQMIQGTGASIVGPAIGGVVAVAFGPAVIYAADVISGVLTLSLLFAMASPTRMPRTEADSRTALTAGFAYARSRPDILGTYVVDLVAMVVAYPVALLPFVAAQYHSTYALGLLYTGLPIGALIVAVSSQWTRRIHHYGRAIVGAAVIWGLGVALFGVAGPLAIAMIGLVIAGAADAVSGIFRMTMWNESIAPSVRGRMAGAEVLSYSLGPTAGQFRAGVVAAASTLRVANVSGGLGCAGICAGLPGVLRSMWAFDVRSDAHVAAVRAEREAADD